MSSDALGIFRGKRLVIFGAGYVGSALAVAARHAGANVIALTRNPDTAQRLAGDGVLTIVAKLQDSRWYDAVAVPDIAVNCVSSGGGGISGYQESYVDGLLSILRWLEQRGRKLDTFIYTSSTSVYPQDTGVVDELSPTDTHSPKGRLLLEAERLVEEAARLDRCHRAVVLRLAGIYGPGRHHLLDQVRSGERVIAGRGDHHLNLIHRDDIVSAIAAASRGPTLAPFDLFNVADDAPTPKAEVIRWLAEQLRVPAPKFSGVASEGRRVSPPDRVISNRKIKHVLCWKPEYPDFRAGYRPLLGA